MKTYSEKLKDPRWQRKRLEIMQRDDFMCYDCGGSNETLSVHHSYYISGRMPWEYPDWSLRTLCKECHESKHLDASSEESFERIMGWLLGNGNGGEMAEYYAHDLSMEYSRLSEIHGRYHAAGMVLRAINEMISGSKSLTQPGMEAMYGR